MCEVTPECIRVQNVFYASNREADLLVDLNMRVDTGTIYGLVGPSGCGKTTLLRCIVGLIFPQYGDISVFGKQPGSPGSRIPGHDVGYMPQEIALYESLSIEETLVYFGKLHLITDKALNLKIEELLQVLELPDKARNVRSLSGGQRRRVSFAVTLIHSPSLIILDEPTSGVDPLLREKIWQKLIALSTMQSTTIIFTTQYIEETRRAHRIGFMRKGRLIVEDSPQSLLDYHKTKTLEDAFLRICSYRKQNSVKIPVTQRTPFKRVRTLCAYTSNWQNDLKNWFHIVFTLLWQNFLRNLRDPMTICFQFILPISQVTLFALCIGGTPRGIPIGVVNEDSGNELSHSFLSQLDTNIMQLKSYSKMQDAISDARRHQIWAVMRIGANFTDNVYARTDVFADIDESLLRSGQITIHADLTDEIVSQSTMRHIFAAFLEFSRKTLEDMDSNPLLAQLPVQVGHTIYGTYDPKSYNGFRDFMIPGLIVNITFAIAYALTSLALITERNNQTFERNFVSGVSCTQILIAHTLSRFAFMVPYVFVITYLPILFFQLPSVGPVYCVIALLLMLNLTGMSYGIVIASVCRHIEMAIIVAAGTLFLLLFASGAIWPLESIPKWFHAFAYSTPTALPTEALRMTLFKGWGFENYNVNIGFGVAFIWVLILFAIGLKSFKYNK